MRIKILLKVTALLLFTSAFSQNLPSQVHYPIARAKGSVKIDGMLDDEAWKGLPYGGAFYQTFPTDNQRAQDSTQFMITYDDQFIYVAIICYDYMPGKQVNNTLRRDFSWILNDNISVYIDPYNDRSNGFTFQLTPDNVQREGLVVLGGEVQDDWDNRWFSGTTRGENAWYAEMAIPYKSIRYNSIPEWNIQFIRNNQKRNERTTWIHVPQQLPASDLVYSGKLRWDTPPPEAGANVAFIPYVSGSSGKDFEEREPSETTGDAGFDAKIGLSNSVNLDLTFNPDFSQVEVDQQVTNLQRFEISFPERRQFFLENQDLFAQNGFSSTRPFFSRRIGIQGSGSTQRNVPIIGGARLSGKIGSKWRVGALNVITGEDETEEEIAPAQNYSVAVLERQVFRRSRISAVFVGRNNLGQAAIDSFRVDNGTLVDQFGREFQPEDTLYKLSSYNYVYGLDYNLATVNNRWEGNFFYHRSADPDGRDDNFAHGAFLRYQTPRINVRAFSRTVGEGYNAEVGFVRREGITASGSFLNLNYFSSGSVQRHGPEVGGRFIVDREGALLDYDYSLEYGFEFLNSAGLFFGYEFNSVTLTDPFDPSGSDGLELAANTVTEWRRYGVEFQSDQRKDFAYSFFVNNGGFFNGDRLNFGTGFIYRLPPIIQIGVDFEFNRIELPEPFSDSDLVLISPRIDLTVSNQVFFTNFIQYNTQDENFGINSRFQWRFKPVSDLFIVYTDNYFTQPFGARNRALVMKLSYWLNI